MRIGVISDTHGLLRESALAALRGCEQLIHAGDIGGPSLLDALRALAPLSVVRGNNDTEAWCRKIPPQARLEYGTTRVLVIHDLKELGSKDYAWQPRVIIAGHSHRPNVQQRDGILYLNPGSAGPRRFRLPVAVAVLSISAARVAARIVELES